MDHASQSMLTYENVHAIVKMKLAFSRKCVLEEYLLCEEMICPWSEIKRLAMCYSCSESDFCDFFIQDTICVNNDYVSKRKETNPMKFGGHALQVLPNICWNLCQIEGCNSFECVRIKINSVLFSRIMLELYHSKIYRKNLLFKLYYSCNQKYKERNALLRYPICNNCQNVLWKIDVFVLLKGPEQDLLNRAWNSRIERLILERCELENAMAWLSTLGGAFSALGDVFIHCAEKAGVISVQQLQIALLLGDPLTICRCRIYLAMSLLQRGYYKRTKQMIRELYEFSTIGEGKRDFRLKNMCVAVWNRLIYINSLTKHSSK